MILRKLVILCLSMLITSSYGIVVDKKTLKYRAYLGKSIEKLEKDFSTAKKVNPNTFVLIKQNSTVIFKLKKNTIQRVEAKGDLVEGQRLSNEKLVLISNAFSGHLPSDSFFMANSVKGIVYKVDKTGKVLSVSYRKPWLDKRKRESFIELRKRVFSRKKVRK